MPTQTTLPVATPERQPASQPVNVIQAAIEKGASPEQLEKLFELQLRYEANEARKAYCVAMAAFKANPPRITKDKHVSFESKGGKTAYNHATLANVVASISAFLSSHGLSATWRTSTDEKGAVHVTCRISHVQGHFEETSLSSAPDNSGGKNSIQAIGSSVTYLQRYCLLALCGLATEEDDDGKGSQAECITEVQAGTIYNLCNELGGTTLARLLKWLGVEDVAQIEVKHFSHVISELQRQRSELQRQKGGE